MIQTKNRQENMQYDNALIKLKEAYIKILEQVDLDALFLNPEGLSGVFLPCPAPDYFAGGPRFLIVGQETRGWRNKSCSLRNTRQIIEQEVVDSMHRARDFASYGARSSIFMQFYRKACSRLQPEATCAAVWSNQFCVSYKSGSPTKLPIETFRAAFGTLR